MLEFIQKNQEIPPTGVFFLFFFSPGGEGGGFGQVIVINISINNTYVDLSSFVPTMISLNYTALWFQGRKGGIQPFGGKVHVGFTDC